MRVLVREQGIGGLLVASKVLLNQESREFIVAAQKEMRSDRKTAGRMRRITTSLLKEDLSGHLVARVRILPIGLLLAGARMVLIQDRRTMIRRVRESL